MDLCRGGSEFDVNLVRSSSNRANRVASLLTKIEKIPDPALLQEIRGSAMRVVQKGNARETSHSQRLYALQVLVNIPTMSFGCSSLSSSP